MKTYGYIRVSTQLQAEEGHSLGAQETQVQAYAQLQGLNLASVFVERGVTGSMPLRFRPEGEKLWNGLGPGDNIVTPKLDRMFRSALDALTVMGQANKLGVHIHIIDLGGDVTANGIGRLVFTILAAVAEAERDRIRERIKDVKGHQRSQGRYLGGGIPFGYSVTTGGFLTPEPSQQHDLLLAYRLWRIGNSLRTLTSLMRSKGHAVSHVSLRRAFQRLKRENHCDRTPPEPDSEH